jgi:septal ring factor EnvC (AmiA/AmiB activator)
MEAPELEIDEAELEPVIGDMTPDAFAGMLAEAMGKAMEPYQKELHEVQASVKTKDDTDAALREALELQAQTISTLKSQLDELTGSQPRAATKGYRASQDAETVVKDDSRVKGKQPTVDQDFVKMFLPQ